MTTPALAGFLTGGSLIVAIGAQNAYVLRQGLHRHHVGGVVALCAISDAVLITAGVAGVGTIVERTPWVIDVVRWLGVAFLLWYAAQSLRQAFVPQSLQAQSLQAQSPDPESLDDRLPAGKDADPTTPGAVPTPATGTASAAHPRLAVRAPAEPRRTVLGRAAALTWLNPHVYLDTVLLIGSIAATHAHQSSHGIDGRWWFAIGAVAASFAWFSALGFGARAMAPVLERPRAWQVLEVVIAATMVFVAAKLALG